MHLRTVERDDYTEYHLTLGCTAVEPTFERLAEVLAREGIAVLQEKVYGPTRERSAILSIRSEQYRARGIPDIPCSYVEGRFCAGEFRGVQVLGCVPRDGRHVTIETVRSRNGVSGRQLSTAKYRVVHLASITGTVAQTNEGGRAAQARCMLGRADAALRQLGLSFAHVARTWIYLRDILDWYREFNGIRTGFLRERGITGQVGRAFPASTGIQGTSHGEACVMDLCAIAAAPETGIEVRPVLHSGRQRAAFDYGSSFSRATAVQIEGRRTVLISGTASIGTDGHSMHVGDRTAQIHETLACIRALIEDQGGCLDDICSATVFAKDAQTLAEFDAMVRRNEVPPIPHVSMVADVCRAELLVEIEALAVIAAGPRNGS